MFARRVSFKLRPGTLADLPRVMESEILPWLRKQKGFLDAITLAVPGDRGIVATTFWDQEENARVYNSMGYPDLLVILKNILAGAPHVKTLDVVSSALRKIDLPKAFFSTVGSTGLGTARKQRIDHIASERFG
jgi:hypothetical protein